MRIYLHRSDYKGHLDEMFECVVIAGSAKLARLVASHNSIDEGRDPWLDPNRSTIECIGTAARSKKANLLVVSNSKGW